MVFADSTKDADCASFGIETDEVARVFDDGPEVLMDVVKPFFEKIVEDAS